VRRVDDADPVNGKTARKIDISAEPAGRRAERYQILQALAETIRSPSLHLNAF
jgi:hypothetical protein